VLSNRGAYIVAAARTIDKAQRACSDIGGVTTPVACELSDPESVRSCARTIKSIGQPLDAVICNAGIMALPKLQTQLGYELQFFTNHIGHFILVTELLDVLADDGRVVMLSSDAHKRAYKEGIQFDNLSGENGYKPWGAYGQSKLANLLFAKQLSKRLEGTNKTANSVHPGVILTNLSRNMNPIFRAILTLSMPLALKSIPQGAATQCYVATHPAAGSFNGEYFADCNVARPNHHGSDDQMAERLWQVSEEIVTGLPS